VDLSGAFTATLRFWARFYFDDLEVVTTGSPVGITGSMGARPEAMRFQPSPAHGSTAGTTRTATLVLE
jgi:hypothetical protein